jgi:hypothetical protein
MTTLKQHAEMLIQTPGLERFGKPGFIQTENDNVVAISFDDIAVGHTVVLTSCNNSGDTIGLLLTPVSPACVTTPLPFNIFQNQLTSLLDTLVEVARTQSYIDDLMQTKFDAYPSSFYEDTYFAQTFISEHSDKKKVEITLSFAGPFIEVDIKNLPVIPGPTQVLSLYMDFETLSKADGGNLSLVRKNAHQNLANINMTVDIQGLETLMDSLVLFGFLAKAGYVGTGAKILQSIYEQGSLARNLGLPQSQNPHTTFNIMALNSWDNGWIETYEHSPLTCEM